MSKLYTYRNSLLTEIAAATGPANPVGCLGAGVILWASAIYGLLVKPFGE